MTLTDTIYRLQRIDDLINRRATGSPVEFAKKLNLSTRRLFEIMDCLREYGLNISYSKEKRSYFYTDTKRLFTLKLPGNGGG